MKNAVLLIIILTLLALTACSENTAMPTDGSPSASVSESTSTPLIETPTVSGTDESDPTEPVVSNDPTQSPAQSTSSNPTQTPGNTNSNPPATSNPTNPPAASTPPPNTSTPPPTTSTPPPTKPTYTEADYKEIENIIRAYGEAKGFIWEESYTFEQGHQYYGRPNIVDLSKEAVISDLKYHCDKIETYAGICYFKVVRHTYQGKLEFIVVYD